MNEQAFQSALNDLIRNTEGISGERIEILLADQCSNTTLGLVLAARLENQKPPERKHRNGQQQPAPACIDGIEIQIDHNRKLAKLIDPSTGLVVGIVKKRETDDNAYYPIPQSAIPRYDCRLDDAPLPLSVINYVNRIL